MKTIYSKTFAKYSPFFLVLMIILLILGFNLRTNVFPSNTDIELFGKFGFTQNFIWNNTGFFHTIEFWASLLTIIAVFFLGMSLIGKTAGLFMAIFLAIYPYYVANTYSFQTITLLFFVLYLFFQLQATIKYSRLFSALAGVFFILSFICNPVCLFLGVIMYIYQAICSRNIGVLYNFLLFVGGAFVMYIIYTIFVSIFQEGIAYMPSIRETFSEFGRNFAIFRAQPLNYINNVIVPLFTDTLASPKLYTVALNKFNYWHYAAIFYSIFGLLYSFIEEKARIVLILTIIVFIQAFFMTINFGFLFLFVIMLASYLVDKVFNDVFC